MGSAGTRAQSLELTPPAGADIWQLPLETKKPLAPTLERGASLIQLAQFRQGGQRLAGGFNAAQLSDQLFGGNQILDRDRSRSV